MIWFACKKCGKTIGKPESSAGAMVFCDCGQGARVPWESTAAAPPVPPAAAKILEPIRFDAADDRPRTLAPNVERRSRRTSIDPNTCFNHATSDKTGVCVDCGLGFCGRCLTTFRNQPYCAACKNYRTRLLQRRPEGSKLAALSFLFALAAGPAMLILIAVASSRHAQPLLLLGLLLPLLSLAAGVFSLRSIRKNSRQGGHQLAIGGIALGAVIALTTAILFVFGDKLA